jgi:glycosyltransferase involved in cell wall biosynthesis
MKIHLANSSKQNIGGGWTFLKTFGKYLKRLDGVEVVDINDAEIVLISSATMVPRDDVLDWKKQGKKIILRVDNIPKNSRNRNTGSSRVKDYAELADLIIYQTEFSKELLMPLTKKEGPVILNGADTEVFNTGGEKQIKDGSPQYMYVQYNKDPTKQFHQAWYEYIFAQRMETDAHLWIIGNFSKDVIQYNFDFCMGEKFSYIGVLEDPRDLAEYYRGCDILMFPAYNDACSNTLIEARNCGVKKILHNETGGNMEIMNAPLEHLSAERMAKEYISEIKKI